jgi:hypothetical protein
MDHRHNLLDFLDALENFLKTLGLESESEMFESNRPAEKKG